MSALIAGALAQVVVAIIGAVGAGILAMLPRLGVYLLAKIHGERVLLLRDTLASGARLSLAKVREGKVGVDRAIDEVVQYVELSMPDTLVKLDLPNGKLHDMALAAYYEAAQKIPRQ